MSEWKNEEIEYLRNNYIKYTNKEIAKHLNKRESEIEWASRKLHLIKQPHKRWSEEDDEYLRHHYLDMTTKELAMYLDRTVSSVDARKGKLGFNKLDKWTKEEMDFLVKHYLDMSYGDIGKVLGKTTTAVNAKSHDLKLFKKEPNWTQEDLEYVKKNYMQMQTREIAENLNRSATAVHLKAKRMGLKKYPYTCNYHFFSSIDTEEKAYWLGFFLADGWMSKNDTNNAGCVGFQLQYGDIAHLKKFNKSIDGNYRITDRWRNCDISTNPEKLNHMCCIRVFSIQMYEDLQNLGMSENKSYNVRFPEIPESLMRHFLRGYFDGDGCFCFTKKSFSIRFVTASKELNDDLVKALRSDGIEIHEYSSLNNFGTTMYNPEIHKNSMKIKFLDYIYKDANIYLERKYKKYLKVKEYFNHDNCLASQK